MTKIPTIFPGLCLVASSGIIVYHPGKPEAQRYQLYIKPPELLVFDTASGEL